MESPMAEQELQYWRQLDESTIAFYFNVERAATDGKGVTHDAGAEVKLSEWVKGVPKEKEIRKLQKEYIDMSDARTLMIGNCNAKIMLPEIYEIQYGFLDSGEAREITTEEYHDGVIKEPGPATTMKRDTNLDG
jgi:hypothetical protein